MGKSAGRLKQITSSNSKPEIKNIKSELVTALLENIIKTKQTIKTSDKSKKPQNTSIDILILIDEFKIRFEKLGEKAKEIAQKDGRTIVTYDDAEKALKLIRAEKYPNKKLD